MSDSDDEDDGSGTVHVRNAKAHVTSGELTARTAPVEAYRIEAPGPPSLRRLDKPSRRPASKKT
jgi:hypothetical protein